ncbi:MAG TPA: WGR domain-containing protein [Candidatus Glassbacteria bacterium]|nr:WGR domain-containing protein [Candidatus Glassbacteria bacterium]
MPKAKVYKRGTEPSFPSDYEVVTRRTLNFTDIIKNNNKFYNAEIQVAKNGFARIFTVYGRVGAPNAAQEYRMASTQYEAERILDDLIKTKTTRKKDPYVEVKLIKASVGSEEGKSQVTKDKVSIETLEKAGVKIQDATPSKLNPEVQSLIRTWFGSTAKFIESNLDTKKCPLGQLSLDQIAKGKDILDESRKIIHSTACDKITELNRLTSSYYSNIPHVLGHKINADVLRFDTDTKIDFAMDILDVFQDAKKVQKLLTVKSNVDSQYETLRASIEYVESSSVTWKWIDSMLHKTRARNHSFLGNLKTHKIFKVSRQNEEDLMFATAEKIAKQCGRFEPSRVYAGLVKERPDISKELLSVYKSANILPGWHGTRRANMVGITTKGLLIRPSGVVHAGSMYGDGIYWATQSTKSINYCDVKGSYWAKGSNRTAYLFLADVAFGNYKKVNGAHYYSKNNIAPAHSVFAEGGNSGVINDEIITYTPSGPGQQHCLRYIVEFETQV